MGCLGCCDGKPQPRDPASAPPAKQRHLRSWAASVGEVASSGRRNLATKAVEPPPLHTHSDSNSSTRRPSTRNQAGGPPAESTSAATARRPAVTVSPFSGPAVQFASESTPNRQISLLREAPISAFGEASNQLAAGTGGSRKRVDQRQQAGPSYANVGPERQATQEGQPHQIPFRAHRVIPVVGNATRSSASLDVSSEGIRTTGRPLAAQPRPPSSRPLGISQPVSLCLTTPPNSLGADAQSLRRPARAPGEPLMAATHTLGRPSSGSGSWRSASEALGAPAGDTANRSQWRDTTVRTPTRAAQDQAAAADSSRMHARMQDAAAGSSTGHAKELRAAVQASKCSSGSVGPRIIKLGIETEFFLAAKKLEDFDISVEGFAETLAANHNQAVRPPHPQMRPTMRPPYEQGDYARWCLATDSTVSFHSSRSPWGVELVSPILRAFPGSKWRESVELTWKCLADRYDIDTNHLCGTHIHISLEPFFNMGELVQIAQAILHFEPAIEALVPKHRRGNEFCKSNWLGSPHLGAANISRPNSIAKIGQIQDPNELIRCMGNEEDRGYSWNFLSLMEKKKRTLEFRKPPGSTTVEETLSWAEFVLSFIQAAIRCGSAEQLQKVPAHIGGLQWFLKQSNVPGVNEHHRLAGLFAGRDPMATLQPKSTYEAVSLQLKQLRGAKKMLMEKADADHRRVLDHAKRAQIPYLA
ncbi:hypothetical protein GJ744_009665 [Endocarpon pusillum]|uniref:Amidoligase enzyme n=1 Tax=Endocarpon pusillum TaxID=364733 RepID=A0A8H7AFC9_9EURO|nr:hypothetical protein GJ744_009665 [Endocarpon pusillum]